MLKQILESVNTKSIESVFSDINGHQDSTKEMEEVLGNLMETEYKKFKTNTIKKGFEDAGFEDEDEMDEYFMTGDKLFLGKKIIIK